MLLLRAPLLVAFALLLLWLLSTSSLLRLLPFAPTPWPVGAWALGALLLALLPALLVTASPLPALLGVAVPVVFLASYANSRLDWLRILKDFGVADPGGVSLARVGLALAVLLAAWAIHAIDLAMRLRWRSLARGIPAGDADAAAQASARASATAAAFAFAGAAGLAVVALLAQRVPLDALTGGRAALVAPLLAGLLVAAAAVGLVVERRRQKEKAAER